MLDELKKIRLLIADNELKAAFKQSKKALVHHPKYVNIAKLSAQFIEVDDRFDLSEIEYDEFLVTKNKIASSFIKTISRIQESIEEQTVIASHSDKDLLIQINNLLQLSYEGFLTQIKVRDKLVESIYLRTHKMPTSQYWEYFYNHFNTMTPIEKILHQRIRSYTKDLIGKYNFKVLDILNANLHLFDLQKDLKKLHLHLDYWKTMYNNEFLQNEGISLVYLLEVGKNFPTGIEAKIKSVIEKL